MIERGKCVYSVYKRARKQQRKKKYEKNEENCG